MAQRGDGTARGGDDGTPRGGKAHGGQGGVGRHTEGRGWHTEGKGGRAHRGRGWHTEGGDSTAHLHTPGTALQSSATAFCHLDLASPFFQGKAPRMNQGDSCVSPFVNGAHVRALTPELSVLPEWSHRGALRTAGRACGQKNWQQPLFQKCFK